MKPLAPLPHRIGETNIRVTLSADKARQVLRRVIVQGEPGIIGCLEWDAGVPDLPDGYKSARPGGKGGKLVVWDNRRYELTGLVMHKLVGAERVGHLPGRKDRLGANYATVAYLRDRRTGRSLVLIAVHLTAEVQRGDSYRKDLAHRLRVARHRREVAATVALALRLGDDEADVFVVGDLNFDGIKHLGPLTACWLGHPEAEKDGTLGGRSVDYVFAEKRARDVQVIVTASDHDAIVAEYR